MLSLSIGAGSIGPYDIISGAKIYWDGVARGEILLRKCRDCGRYSHPRQEACENCFSPALDWEKSAGSGVIYTFSTIYRAPHARPVPYTVGMVELPERVFIFAEIAQSDAIAIGAAVSPIFVPTERGTLLKFQLTNEGSTHAI
jgi:uncharacterized OB-fold protein